MLYEFDVCCEECKNYEDVAACSDCIHSEHLNDNYEPASAELMKKREAQFRKQFFDSIPKDEVVFDLKLEFKVAIEKAWSFVPDWYLGNYHYYFAGCFDGFIMACDGFRLIKVITSVPDELIGKNVVLDKEEGKFFVRRKIGNQAIDCVPIFENGQAQEKFDEAERGEVIKCYKGLLPIEGTKKQENGKEPIHVLFNKNIALNKIWIEQLLTMFTDSEEITVHFKGPLDAVKFSAGDIEAIILPMRIN